jgi:outer membrane protein assembly factor BamD (BamD/ComL family)
VKKLILLCALVAAFSMAGMAISAAQTSDDLLVRGYEAYNQRDWPTAVQSYRNAVSNPRYSTAENWFMLILSELYAGEYGNVITDGEVFLASFPGSSYCPYVRYHIGRANYLTGNYSNAAYYLTEFCHSYPSHELFPSALYWIAESFFARENYDAARALYERIIRDFPGDAKRADAQSRIETIKWFRRTESQFQADLMNRQLSSSAPVRGDGYFELPENLSAAVPQSQPYNQPPAAVPQSQPSNPPPVAVPQMYGKQPETDQQQFVSTLVTLNAQLDKDKQVLNQRVQIVTDLIIRNTTPNVPQKWTPEQQRFIADVLARNTNNVTLSYGSVGTPLQQDLMIAELLTRNADLNYRQVPLNQRQQLVTDLNALNNKMVEDMQHIEGQQRLIAEVITNSMGLNDGFVRSGVQPGVIDNRLSNLETQFNDPNQRSAESTEYQSLLNKARTLWTIIEERNKY